MNRVFKSKVAALLLVGLTVAYIIFTYPTRAVSVWMFADAFFLFMGAFTHLMALTLSKVNPRACNQLETTACLFGIAFVVSFLAEYIVIRY